MATPAPQDDSLPPFDVKSNCVKCGYVIPEPIAPEPKLGPKGADGKQVALPAPPPPPPQPPTVTYCNGEQCPYGEPEEPADEHMHQFCDVCGYEWLSLPLDA